MRSVLSRVLQQYLTLALSRSKKNKIDLGAHLVLQPNLELAPIVERETNAVVVDG